MIYSIKKEIISLDAVITDEYSIKLIKAAQFMVLAGHVTRNGSWAEGNGDWAYTVNTKIITALAKEAGFTDIDIFMKSPYCFELNCILGSMAGVCVYRLSKSEITIQKASSNNIHDPIDYCEYVDLARLREYVESDRKMLEYFNEKTLRFCEYLLEIRGMRIFDYSFDGRCFYSLENIINTGDVEKFAAGLFSKEMYMSVKIDEILKDSLKSYAVSRYVDTTNVQAFKDFITSKNL